MCSGICTCNARCLSSNLGTNEVKKKQLCTHVSLMETIITFSLAEMGFRQIEIPVVFFMNV